MSHALVDELASLLSRPFDESLSGDLLAYFISSLDDAKDKEVAHVCMLEAIHSISSDQRRPWLGSISLDFFLYLITSAISDAHVSSGGVLMLLEELVAASSPREAVMFVLEALSSCCSKEAEAPLVFHILSLLLKAILGLSSPKQRAMNALAALPSIARAADLLSLHLDQDSALETFVHILGDFKDKILIEIHNLKQLSLLALHIVSSFSSLSSLSSSTSLSLLILGILRDGYGLTETESLEQWLMLHQEVKATLKDMEESESLDDVKIKAGIALLALLHSNPTSNSSALRTLTRIDILEAGLSISQSLITEASRRESNAILAKAMDLIARTGVMASHSPTDGSSEDEGVEQMALDLSKILAINVVFGSDPSLGKKSYQSLSSLLAGLTPSLRLRIIHSLAGWPRDGPDPPPPTVVSLALSLLQHQIMRALTQPGPSSQAFISTFALGPIPLIIRDFVNKASPCQSIEEGNGEVVFSALNLLRSICLYYDTHETSPRSSLKEIARRLCNEARSFIQNASAPEAGSHEETEVMLHRLTLASDL